MGMGPRAAAVLGARQVFFAVIATTATLAAVFIPISFFPGTAGRLFSEFGFVMAFAVVLSAFVALTLTPMLASRILREHEGESAYLKNPLLRRLGAFGAARRGALPPPARQGARARRWSWSRRRSSSPASRRSSTRCSPSSSRRPRIAASSRSRSARRRASASTSWTCRCGRSRPRSSRSSRAARSPTCSCSPASSGGNSGFVVLTLAPWEERTRSAQEIIARAQSAAAEDPRRPGLDAPGQQPRHPRRRPGPAVRHHRQRLRHARRQGDRAAAGAGGRCRASTPCASTTTPRSRSFRSQIDRERPPTSACRSRRSARRSRRCSTARSSANSTSAATRSRSARRRRTG